jgi:hypothetical protein
MDTSCYTPLPVLLLFSAVQLRQSPCKLHVMLSDGSTISHTMLATAKPASTPSAFARKVAVACVDSGMLQHIAGPTEHKLMTSCTTVNCSLH